MANDVFANGRELACKSGAGKTICAFPDTCFTPPENPATPPGIPVPYPNTGFASDTTNGSKTVKITKKEIMLKDQSYFKTSVGDEAGCAAKKGVITSVNKGKVYFQAWSMDVKVEGENVDRHLDLTTNNHASDPGDTPPMIFSDRMAMAKVKDCKDQKKKIKDACDPWKEKSKCLDTKKFDAANDEATEIYNDLWNRNLDIPTKSKEWELKKKRSKKYQAALKKKNKEYENYARKVNRNECHRALKCALTPYDPSKCCPPETPHHLIDDNSFKTPPVAAYIGSDGGKKARDAAPCICATGPDNKTATHGLLHLRQREELAKLSPPIKLKDGFEVAKKAVKKVFPNSDCDPDCLEAQLKNEYRKMKIGVNQPINPTPSGKTVQSFDKAWQKFNENLVKG